MELTEAIYTRRSVRAYTPEPVEKDTIEQLIEAATQAPSAMNAQPLAFGVIQGVEALKQYSDRAKVVLLGMMDQFTQLERYRGTLSDPGFNIFYDAPALVIIYAKPGAAMPETDCTLAAENLMLAARGQDLGTCWIGFSYWFFNLPEVKQELGVPADYIAVAPIIVGHPAGSIPPVEKNPPDILFWK